MSVSLTHYQQVGKVAADDMSSRGMLYQYRVIQKYIVIQQVVFNIIMKWLAYSLYSFTISI